jgi:cell division protein FtsB
VATIAHANSRLGEQMFKTTLVVVCVLAPALAHADEDCLTFVAHEQQIACLARQNAFLRAAVNDLTQTVQNLKGGVQNNSQVRLRNKAWAGDSICLDNASQNMNVIQGWTCNSTDFQVWTIEKVQ